MYMSFNDLPINRVLTGPQAFYNQIDYPKATKDELASSETLKSPAYRYDTETKVWRCVKDILSVIIFPIGIYRLLHSLGGKIIVPASKPSLLGYEPTHADDSRKAVNLQSDWKVKRLMIEVDGYKIDAAIMGRASTLGNGRWLLASNGNGEFYEDNLSDASFKQILTHVDGNAILFNYPGVGSSSGLPNRQAMAKAYRAVLAFLEDQKLGIGAKVIIGYGHSIGAAIQGEALNAHLLKDGIKYVFVKSRTFSDLSTVAAKIVARPVGLLVKLLGWNITTMASSKQLKAPEIIMQTAAVPKGKYVDISNRPDLISRNDGVIPAEATLAKHLMEDNDCPKQNKCFIGIAEGHNDGLWNSAPLAGKINEMLTNTN